MKANIQINIQNSPAGCTPSFKRPVHRVPHVHEMITDAMYDMPGLTGYYEVIGVEHNMGGDRFVPDAIVTVIMRNRLT